MAGAGEEGKEEGPLVRRFCFSRPSKSHVHSSRTVSFPNIHRVQTTADTFRSVRTSSLHTAPYAATPVPFPPPRACSLPWSYLLVIGAESDRWSSIVVPTGGLSLSTYFRIFAYRKAKCSSVLLRKIRQRSPDFPLALFHEKPGCTLPVHPFAMPRHGSLCAKANQPPAPNHQLNAGIFTWIPAFCASCRYS